MNIENYKHLIVEEPEKVEKLPTADGRYRLSDIAQMPKSFIAKHRADVLASLVSPLPEEVTP